MQPPARIRSTTTKTTPVTTPAATTPALTSSDYYLTSARATIYTGNDNKEKPSQVQMQMAFGNEGVGNYLVPTSEYREFAVNSVNELQLKLLHDWTRLYEKLQLVNAENGGIKFWIHYSPNFPLDAWKIEKVVFTLEFRDLKGNLHPTVGNRTITFMNVGALLNSDHYSLKCEADQFLMPRSTIVGKF